MPFGKAASRQPVGRGLSIYQFFAIRYDRLRASAVWMSRRVFAADGWAGG
jgi:hypothetical protein